MDSEKVIKRDNEYVLHTYNRNPIVLEKGHGLRAAGPEGQQYLDFTSGIGVNSLGSVSYTHLDVYKRQVQELAGGQVSSCNIFPFVCFHTFTRKFHPTGIVAGGTAAGALSPAAALPFLEEIK